MALTTRMQRGVVIGWTTAAVLLGLFYGSLGSQVEGMVAANPAAVTAIGGDPQNVVDGFLATMLVYVSILASALGIICISRIRTEESVGRAEIALSTAVSRLRWIGTGAAVAAVASCITQVLGAFTLGLSSAAALQDPTLVARLTAASLNYLPIALVFVALATLLVGAAPRLFPLTWVTFAGSLSVTLFSGFANLPPEIARVSVFNLPALVPLTDVDVVALAAMLLAATAMVGAGLLAFRRRDIGR
ncbi:MAG: hypothetical protein H7Y15_18810 [Pseudonocardia sp.]|nr:hypothetical protein [Pseudonocardia sp.]